MELAVELIYNVTLSIGAWPSHVPGLVACSGNGPGAGDVIGIKIKVAVSIRVEIDRVSDPHRITAWTRIVGNLFRVECFQIEDIELIGLSAAVALLGSEVS